MVYALPHASWQYFNLIALSKAKIVYNFGLAECNRVKVYGCIRIFYHYFYGGEQLLLLLKMKSFEKRVHYY